MRNVYLGLAVLGLVVPYGFFLPWVMDHGLDIPLFLSELFSTRIGGFFGVDVIISALALIAFILVDSRKHAVRPAWLPIAGTLCVGVSFGLPLYLYLRERASADA